MTRARIIAVLAGVGVAGLVAASAASLGTITSDNLGASVGVVASCDTDGVTVEFTTEYNATEGEYVVTEVEVGGIAAACVGQELDLTLMDDADASLADGSVTVAGASETVALSANASAEAVTGVAIIISGEA